MAVVPTNTPPRETTPTPMGVPAALLATLHRCDAELSEHVQVMKGFIKEHALLFDGLMQVTNLRAESLRQRESIERTWRQLHQEYGRLLNQRSMANQAWAESQRKAAA